MKDYQSAYSRWAGIGPYYAMFPLDFVEGVIQRYTRPGQSILDPFAGRASSVFAGANQGRPSIGIEINPVGWLYAQAKLHPAPKGVVLTRLAEISGLADDLPPDAGTELSPFFRHCFAKRSRRFLLAARSALNWRQSHADQTLMALILVDLHGARARSFSNQMRQGRAMEPNYSVQWWRDHHQKPPQIEPVAFMQKKIDWRYAKGRPTTSAGRVLLGDSRQLLTRVAADIHSGKTPPISLLFTSPPYMKISDYHRDQWLRLWMLGGEPYYSRRQDNLRRDFSSKPTYLNLLQSVFEQSAEIMKASGWVYVRTDARAETFETTYQILRQCFPRWQSQVVDRPYQRDTQTALYGDKAKKPGEKDIILHGPR